MIYFIKRFFVFFILIGCVAPNSDYVSYSAQFVGAPYILDSLGEGVPPDADPLIRFDAFDCTTFVETVLARGDVEKLNKIRYSDGIPDFILRNHFIESDWLRNNRDLVENVSSDYAPTEIRTVKIDKQRWFARVHHTDTDFVPQIVDIEYIPYKNVHNIKADETLIVLFITGNSDYYDKIGTDIAVVHMGFLLPNGTLRHASSALGRVVDVDFVEYCANRAKSQNNLGITLVKIK